MEKETLRYFSFHKIITFVRKYNINVWLYLIKLHDQIVQAIDDTEDQEDISMRNFSSNNNNSGKKLCSKIILFPFIWKKSQFQNYNLPINKSSRKRGDRVSR